MHDKYIKMRDQFLNEQMERKIFKYLTTPPIGKLHPPQDFTVTDNENGETVVNMKSPETYRGYVLSHAKRLTEGDRNQAHGDPYPMMETFAQIVSTYLSISTNTKIALLPHDAAMILQLYKVCRIAQNPFHTDSHYDNCAYGAIVAECAHRRNIGDSIND